MAILSAPVVAGQRLSLSVGANTKNLNVLGLFTQSGCRGFFPLNWKRSDAE